MLRWFKNQMDISGPQDRIRSLIETNFDFDRIVPEPFLGDDNTKIYNWRCEHWGSVWTSRFATKRKYQGPSIAELSVSFDSFASPPIPIWEKLADEVSVSAYFFEPSTTMLGHYANDCTKLFYPDGLVTVVNDQVQYEPYESIEKYFAGDSLSQKFRLIFPEVLH
ncbi:hypothetical protein KF707_19535 [Candidatus Obscuribacterales bacterium]|nr:hypothetical protein [Cyclobacteriaceae bacterium]MBX3138429.1 hypothetical protein [Candidatus Obscuribacterales bacterium]